MKNRSEWQEERVDNNRRGKYKEKWSDRKRDRKRDRIGGKYDRHGKGDFYDTDMFDGI